MGKGIKDPPTFSQHSSYTRWKDKVEAWKTVAVANKFCEESTIGQILALSLPSTPEEGDIRGKVMDAVGGDKLKGTDGYKNLIDWMDTHMGRDDTTTTIDKIRDFMKYRRREDQRINDYIAGFDAKYNAAVNSGLDKLPQAYLMWLIIDNAEVSEQDSKLIMAGITLTTKTTLYQQAKESITKYLAGPGSRLDTDKGIKVKNDTFFTKNPHWRPPSSYTPRFSMGGRGGGGGGSSFRGGGAGTMTGGYRGGGTGGYGGGKPKTEVHIPMNPIKNGKRSLCDICGAWTHFKRDCSLNPKPAMYGDIPDAQDTEGAAYHVDNEFAYVAHTNEEQEEEIEEEELKETHFTENVEDHKNDHVAALISMLENCSNTEEINTFTVEVLTAEVLHTLVARGLIHPGQVVLDTGCIESVASSEWINAFIEYLHPSTRKLVKVEKSNRVFKFGGGEKRPSIGTFHIPCSLEGKNLILTVDAVHQEGLPCLLSKKAMKNADTIINVGNDTATIFGTTVELKENQAGHYVARFEDFAYKDGEVAVMWTGFEDKSEEQVEEELRRMHRGLGHPSQVCMERMLRHTGHFNKHVSLKLNKLYKACDTCLKHAKSKPSPKVAPPTAYDVGECLSIDLKIYKKWDKVILYMLDEFSRYMVAESIPNKEGETVVKSILDKWIMGTPYGAPLQIKSDNGGEFVNSSMRDLCEMYNIKHLTTGAFSPFSNGGNERNHHTVDLMLEKIMHGDPNIEFEDALAQAVYAKNSLLNVHGFSPNQILTGKQPRMPGACQENKPPADATEINSRAVQQSINHRLKAREAWAKVDNSKRLRDSMKVQHQPLVKYDTGDTVYYKF